MKTVIYGNGSMARVLFSYAKRSMDICGFTVDDSCIAENANTFCGLPLIPFSVAQDVFAPNECNMILAMGFLQMNDLRRVKHIEAAQKGYSFARYIHESVILHEGVSIEDDCIVLDHVSIHPGSTIGQGTFISSNVNIGHDCIIEPYNYITSGVSIAGGCHIGAGCFFGVNSSVAHGVRSGARTFVGANTLLNKNTEEESVYISEPGQIFRLKSKAFLTFSRMLDN